MTQQLSGPPSPPKNPAGTSLPAHQPPGSPPAPVFHADYNCKNIVVQSHSANVAVSNLLLSKLTSKQYSATLPQDLLRENVASPPLPKPDMDLPESQDTSQEQQKILPDIWKHPGDESSVLRPDQLSVLEREYHDKVNLDVFRSADGRVPEAILRVLAAAAKGGSLSRLNGNCGICEQLLRRFQLKKAPLWSFQNPLTKIAQSNLDCKYTASQEYYNIKLVNDIIYNQMTHLVCKFKDCLIMDDTSQFLKRYYQAEESKGRLPQILDFYETYSKVFPNYIILQQKKYMFQNIQRKQIAIDRRAALRHRNPEEEKRQELSDSERLFDTQFMDSLRRDDKKIEKPKAMQNELAKVIQSYFDKDSDKSVNTSRLSVYRRPSLALDESGYTSLFTVHQGGEVWNQISRFESSELEESKTKEVPALSELKQQYETALSMLNRKEKGELQQPGSAAVASARPISSTSSKASAAGFKNKQKANPQQPHSQTVSLSTCNQNTVSGQQQPYGPSAQKSRSLSKNTVHTKSQGNLHTLSPKNKRMVMIEPTYEKVMEVARGVIKKPMLRSSGKVVATHKLKIEIPSESPKSSGKGTRSVQRKKKLKSESQTVGDNYGSGSPKGGASPRRSEIEPKRSVILSPRASTERSRDQTGLGRPNSRNTQSRQKLSRDSSAQRKHPQREDTERCETQRTERTLEGESSSEKKDFPMFASQSQPNFNFQKTSNRLLNIIPESTEGQREAEVEARAVEQRSLKEIRSMVKNTSLHQPIPKLRGHTPKRILRSDDATESLLQRAKQDLEKSAASSRMPKVRAGIKTELISYLPQHSNKPSSIYSKASPPIPPQSMQLGNATLMKRPGARQPISRVSLKKAKKTASPRPIEQAQRTPGKHKRSSSIKSITLNRAQVPSLALNLNKLVSNRTSTEGDFASTRARPKSRHEQRAVAHGGISNLKETPSDAGMIAGGGALTDRSHHRFSSLQRNTLPKECFATGMDIPMSRDSASGKRRKFETTGSAANFYSSKRGYSRSIENSSERVQFGGGKSGKRAIVVKKKIQQQQRKGKKGQGSRSEFFFPQELRGESRLLQNTDPSSLVIVRGSPQPRRKLPLPDPQSSERNSIAASSFRQRDLEPFLPSSKSRNKLDHQRGASLGGILTRIKRNLKRPFK